MYSEIKKNEGEDAICPPVIENAFQFTDDADTKLFIDALRETDRQVFIMENKKTIP